jgi:hypothetical protein
VDHHIILIELILVIKLWAHTRTSMHIRRYAPPCPKISSAPEKIGL